MMTENFLLKLIVYQGKDWSLSEDSTVFIRASLGKNIAGTTPAIYKSPCPKFNAELCWEVDRKTLRGLKLNRLPIKVEFIAETQHCQKLLGYVILPLSLAAEKIEVKAQWYKLLGGKLGSHKESPHILMALSLTDADLEENEPSSEEEVWPEKDEVDTEDSEHEERPAGTNGYNSNHRENSNSVNQNGCSYNTDENSDEEVEDEEMVVNDSYEHCSDEDLYGDLSDVESQEFEGKLNNAEEIFSSEEMNFHHKEDESSDIHPSFEEKKQLSKIKEKDGSHVSSPIVNKEANESCKLLTCRSQIRKQLRRLSKEHSLSHAGNSSHCKEGVSFETRRSLDLSEISSSANKRSLDNSEIKNPAKVRKIDKSMDIKDISFDSISNAKIKTSLPMKDGSCERINNSSRMNVTDGILKKSSGSNLKRNQSSSIIDILLSHSAVNHSDSDVNGSAMKDVPCRAELSEDNGFFRIFPTDSGEQKKYLFSVTIVYAKNLHQVISDALWSKMKQDGLQFKYSLFGCSVFTEPFFTIDGQITLSERGTATVSSSESQLIKYFSQNSFLPVDLISGNMIIASCMVDLEKLQTIDYRQQVSIEGAFDLVACPAFSGHVNCNQSTIGVCVELCHEKATNKRDKIYLTKKSNKFSETRFENHSHKQARMSRLEDTSCTSSESDSEEELLSRIASKLKWGRNKYKNKKLMHAMKKEKRDYLQEAALEIENWKEEQKQTFLKKWEAREETLQKHLATEWNSKVKIFENILEQRLTGCGELQDKLSQALDKLSIQENQLRDKEIKITKMEKDLRVELNKVKNSHGEAIQKSVVIDNKKIDLLENEVKKLKEHARSTEKNSKDQMKEIFSLRKRMLETEDTRIIKRENLRLSEQLTLTEEKKQYYKHQWTSAIADLHSIHLAKKHNTELQIDDSIPSVSNCSNLGIKIKHLIEERKALTESGLYPHSHSMVRDIDKKIKALINSTQNI